MDDQIKAASQARQNIPYGDVSQVGGNVTDFITGTVAPAEDKAFADYALAQRAQAKPLDLYNQFEENAGLPQMRKTASSLRGAIGTVEDAIKQVEPDISLRSRNSLVTEAQRRGMVTAGQQPLLQRLSELSTGLGRVEQGVTAAGADIAQKVGLVMQGQQIDRETFKMNLDMAISRGAQLISGFTSDRAARTEFLMDKLNRQRVLADSEWQELNELKKMKVAHDYEMSRLNKEAENTMRLAQFNASQPSFQSVGENSKGYLINPQTGATIKTFGGGGGGSGGGGYNYNFNSGSGGAWY